VVENFGVAYLVHKDKPSNLIKIDYSSHVGYILRHPMEFGITPNDINVFRKKTSYDSGSSILNRIYKNGWLRIRNFNNNLSIEYGDISDYILSEVILKIPNITSNTDIYLGDILLNDYINIPSYAYFLNHNASVAKCRYDLNNKSEISQFREQYANIVNKLMKLSYVVKEVK